MFFGKFVNQNHSFFSTLTKWLPLNISLQSEPHIVSYYCAKHLFMFEMDLQLLKRKINLVENNILPEYILRDLDILARAEHKIVARIKYLQMRRVGHIMPWVRQSVSFHWRPQNFRQKLSAVD